MGLLDSLGELFHSFAPFLSVVAVVALVWYGMRWLLLRKSLTLESERKLPRQLAMLGLTALGVLAIVLALPVSNETRNQLLTVLGLLASGIIALSSTTLVANAMAGLMLRATHSFRTGDFIRVGEHFGRVTERGILDTEIQTEDRELTALPNLYLITHPVTAVRSSGTLVSVSLSLGYDVHHARIKPLLIEAAKQAELEEPFVRILELGNFSVTYRVSGFLTDTKNLLTARSKLCGKVLDELHGAAIEIVSPAFMNQRPLPPDRQVIPAAPADVAPKEDQPVPEDIMFDKAERAERMEGFQLRLQADIKAIQEQLSQKSGAEREALQERLDRRKKQLTKLQNALAPKEPTGGTN